MQQRFSMFRWDPRHVAHIARHNILPEDVDEVLEDEHCRLLRGRDERYLLYGRTEAGRMIIVVIAGDVGRIGIPITSRDVTDAERRRFF